MELEPRIRIRLPMPMVPVEFTTCTPAERPWIRSLMFVIGAWSTMSSALICAMSWPSSRFRCSPVAVTTSSSSAMADWERLKFTMAASPSLTVTVLTAGPKPMNSARTWWVPVGTFWMRKRPSSLVMAPKLVPWMETCAPWRGRMSDAAVTAPVTVPRSCAVAGATESRNAPHIIVIHPTQCPRRSSMMCLPGRVGTADRAPGSGPGRPACFRISFQAHVSIEFRHPKRELRI